MIFRNQLCLSPFYFSGLMAPEFSDIHPWSLLVDKLPLTIAEAMAWWIPSHHTGSPISRQALCLTVLSAVDSEGSIAS